MSYTANSQIKTPLQHREREMLLAGFSYAEITQALGCSRKALSARNQIIYKINLQEAFARRIERDGIPNRLNISDAFGYWFAGFFDGEGHLGVFSRLQGIYTERRLTIQIMLRDDDTDVITRIKDNIGVGRAYADKGRGTTNPKATFRVEKIEDLAQVIVPLFDKYPLYSKKAREFAIWREMVRVKYIATLGGYSQRVAATERENAAFDAGLQAIAKIRHYTASRAEHSP